MTEAELQAAIHSLYEGDTSTPSSTDEDYLARRAMMNTAINRWEHLEGTQWRELWTTLTAAADGDKSTDGGSTYDAPTNFRFPGGYVRLVSDDTSTYYRVESVEKIQNYDNVDKNVCYFTGNSQDGYTLNFLDTPESGKTIKYEYYKTADTLTATNSTPEMVDPYFIVYFTLARLYKLDNLAGQSVEASRDAEARLGQMKVKNMMQAWNQDNSILDRDFEVGVGGFGI